jgi:hypothetical protein
MKPWKWSVATSSKNAYHGSFAVNPIIDYVPGRFRENREKSDPHHEIELSPASWLLFGKFASIVKKAAPMRFRYHRYKLRS